MKKFLWIVFVFAFVAPVPAEESQVGALQEYSGVIQEKPWAKEFESYCQAGSEYFVLETEQGEILPLNSARDRAISEAQYIDLQERLKTLVGKNVALKGEAVVLSLAEEEHCPPDSQCVQGDISCSFLRVLEITEVP